MARASQKKWALRILATVFFALVGVVIWRMARTLDWDTVVSTLAGYRPGTLLIAAALAACSYCVYGAFELVARRYSGHDLPKPLTGLVGAMAYAFNMNLGAWLGGIGFRYRLYSRLGVETATTARIYLSALLSNWTGFVAVAGVAFVFSGLSLPSQWELGHVGLRGLGVLLLIAAVAFQWVCSRWPERHLTLRGHEIDLPREPLPALQMALGAVNWMLMAGIVYTLMPEAHADVGYGTVLTTLLVASVAGVVLHVPGGLGVLEAAFLALLGHRVPESQLLGALLAYRAVYFLGPLVLAGIAYAGLEAALRAQPSPKRAY